MITMMMMMISKKISMIKTQPGPLELPIPMFQCCR